MKALRIFLLVLIIIGLGLIDTRDKWLPSVVAHFTANDIALAIVQPEEQSNLTLKEGRQCYAYSIEPTANAPYKVSEFLDITIKGEKVEGSKKGTQSGPDMTNGYNGSITGTLKDNMISGVFAYTIEGSKNKEKEIYHTSKVGLEKLRYPLIEQKGVLVPDTTKEYTTMSYARIVCTASN
jgi:hypothetical protein